MPKTSVLKKKKRKGSKKLENQGRSSSCPTGKHWVRTHSMKVLPSKKNPTGITTRRGHCARNPAGKEKVTPTQIRDLLKSLSPQPKKMPCSLRLDFGSGDKYDDLIAKWTQYWNEVFKPDVPLDPNLVKALIASESGFDRNNVAKKTDPKSARGLTQITDQTRIILGNQKGELKDHLIELSPEDLFDANLNTYAGIRWLFYKRIRASKKLDKSASWEEAVAEYKSLTRSLKSKKASEKKRAEKLLHDFKDYYKKYRECKKA